MERELVVSMICRSNLWLKSKVMLALVRVLNHARPYSTLKRKSRPFLDLSPVLFMFFRSRIDASHLRIIGHAVYREHVRRGPCIGRMSVRITAQIVKTGDHFVLQTLVHNILAPEITHAVLDPFKIRDCDATGIRQNVRNHENSFAVEDLIGGCRGRTISPFGKDLT